jgi:dephospho-CoA kinase
VTRKKHRRPDEAGDKREPGRENSVSSPVTLSPWHPVTPSSRHPVIGLIGGIGSGKTLVAEEFKKRGGYLVSGDALGHEALRQPGIREQVVQRWGAQVLASDGEIDRRKLGRIVFADAAERRALEALVFPHIERRFREEIARSAADPQVAFVILDAAVLLEAGWNKMCTHIVFVHAPREIRLERLYRQRGWTENELSARESAQMPLNEKKQKADIVIDNSGSPEEVASEVDALVRKFVQAARLVERTH